MNVAFNSTPVGKGRASDVKRTLKSRKKGSFPSRIVFKIEGDSYSITECLERTGMEEKAFRKKYTRLIERKSFGWDDFKCK